MSKTYAIMPFQVAPEFKKEFEWEAKRLGIPQVELLRRIFKTHLSVTAEETKRKKRALNTPVKPEFEGSGPRQETISQSPNTDQPRPKMQPEPLAPHERGL